MKILQINSVCGYGSTGKIVVDLYRMLEKEGHDCLIAYGRGGAPSDIKTIKIGSKSDFYCHALTTRFLDRHGFASQGATKRLIEAVKTYRPDVIHLHNLHGYYLNIKILFDFLAQTDIPVVWTLHDCWAFTGHCAYFDYVNCSKWETACCDCPQREQYPKSIADRCENNFRDKRELFTSAAHMRIVTPSVWLADLVKRSFLQKYLVQTVYNGIDLSVFKPTESAFRAKYHLEDKTVVLGAASVWDRRKGLEAFARLAEKLDGTYQIVLVGVTDGQKKMLPDSVLAFSRMENTDELAQLYSAADVFVNPTLEETLGMVNIEALACATPVVTYKTGGSPECIDETCGIAVEKGDIDALAAAVMRVKTHPFDKEACLKKARAFEKNASYAAYLDIYRAMSAGDGE